MASENQSVSSKRRAAGGGSFLIPSLSLGLSQFPYRIDAFPAAELRAYSGFEPLPLNPNRPDLE